MKAVSSRYPSKERRSIYEVQSIGTKIQRLEIFLNLGYLFGYIYFFSVIIRWNKDSAAAAIKDDLEYHFGYFFDYAFFYLHLS